MSVTVNSTGIGWTSTGSSITDSYDLTIDTSNTFVLNALTILKTGYKINGNDRTSSFYINTSSSYNPTSQYGFQNYGGTTGKINQSVMNFSNYISLITWHRILCGEEIDCYSDKRIKQNIREIPKEFAYHTIRNLVPVSYHYKDVVKKGGNLNYGFIAQEVDPIVPFVVKKTIDFIPNIYEVATISDNKITLNQFSTKDLIHRDSRMKIKIFDHKDTEYIVSLEEIIDDKTFRIQEEMMSHFPDNKIFVYGQEVDDLHTLEKNGLFSLTTAAVKYLDADLQETKSMVEKQQGEIDSLKSELQTLKEMWMSRPDIGGGGGR